ncbi:MAG: hypothetical protein WBP29_12635 [Candidatus Zixiibacteriota bacterium]
MREVGAKFFVADDINVSDARCVSEELQSILKDAFLRERKVNLLYTSLLDQDGEGAAADEFFLKAREDQGGDLQVLHEINRRYGNEDIDPSMLEKVGEGILNLRAGRKDRNQLLKQVLDWETELVEVYKQSLRYLSNDDETRKLINRMLTVKMNHRRELMDKLAMF